jgi:hypothetical protein
MKQVVIFADPKGDKFLDRLSKVGKVARAGIKKGKRKFSKNFQKNTMRLKKLYFAPASRDTQTL